MIGLPPLLRWAIRGVERHLPRHGLSDHWIVLGFGRVGQALVTDLLVSSDKFDLRAVVIVDVGGQSANLDWARSHGAIVRVADAADEEEFSAIAVARARGILVATGMEARNIDITGRIAGLVGRVHAASVSPRKEPPRIAPHINDPDLLAWADTENGYRRLLGGTVAEGESLGKEVVRVLPFCSDRIAVRQLLTQRPLAEHAALRPVRRPHLLILGSDDVSRWLIVHLLQVARMQGMDGPRITLMVDGDAAKAKAVGQALFKRYPLLDPEAQQHEPMRAYLQVDFVVTHHDFAHLDASIFDKADGITGAGILGTGPDMGAGLSKGVHRARSWLTGMEPLPDDPEAALADLKEMGISPPGDPVTGIFICFDNDDRNLNVAMELQRLIQAHRRWEAPTFLRLIRDSGLDRSPNQADRQTDLALVIDEFGQDLRVCNREEIFYPPRDRAASAAHMEYEIGSRAGAIGKALAKAKRQSTQKSAVVPEEKEPDGLSGLLEMTLDGHCPKLEAVEDLMKKELASATDRDSRLDLEAAYKVFDQLEPLLKELRRLGGESSQSGSMSLGETAWEDLPPYMLNSNRDKVDHIPTKLLGMGYRACRVAGGQKSESRIAGVWPARPMEEIYLEEFLTAYKKEDKTEGTISSEARNLENREGSDEEINQKKGERLKELLVQDAALEHSRWCVERLMGGWRWGPIRDDRLRVHPALLVRETLPDQESRKDERSTANLEPITREVYLDGKPRIWRPEYRIGCLGPATLASSQIKQLNDLLPEIMARIIKAENLARQGPSNPNAEDAPAVCILSTLGPGAPLRMASAMRDWACCERGEADKKQKTASPHRLRFIIPRDVPFELESTGYEPMAVPEDIELRQGLLAKPDQPDANLVDWWHIDLMPEGLPNSAMDCNKHPDCPPPAPGEPGRPGKNWSIPEKDEPESERASDAPVASTTSSKNEAKEKLNDLRKRIREELLAPRATAYLVERSDWLIVVRYKDENNAEAPEQKSSADAEIRRALEWRCSEEQTIPEHFTSLPSGRPAPFRPKMTESECPVEPAESNLVIEPRHRLVIITLEPAKTDGHGKGKAAPASHAR